jgi:phosphoserine aminotransferase
MSQNPICFYPGPSKVYPQIKGFLNDAFEEGVLSMQHRSPAFVDISRRAILTLKEKLDIPKGYQVFYTSSSTECWQILTQAFEDLDSYHIFNGAFGQKWFEYRQKLAPKTTFAHPFDFQTAFDIDSLGDISTNSLICLTQNETSNATQIANSVIRNLRKAYSNSLICVDVTSSFGGQVLDWENIDVGLTSVQKCLGMPAGMGLMIVSPRALERAKVFDKQLYYNSLSFLNEKMQNYQTTYTPNVLNIYLLMRVTELIEPIQTVSKRIEKQAQNWYNFFEKQGFELLVKDKSLRSQTVIALEDKPENILKIKKSALQNGFVLGNGYGNWKDTTLRIANFPTLTLAEQMKLMLFFGKFD